ncbi:aminopeptidase [Novosphingobium sediminis]|uniref:Aminopeptidase n=1 Tax=Novosphingobium sediminis TaxID=707214 RepID=A0A512AIP6_9SPHN|nr:M1 family metallopeptidase [Novosphingobium sediminis]GEN99587.1 aminopeptidase [Novosphingobium sediminis]
MRTIMLAATLLAGTFLASPALAQQVATETPIPAEAGQMPAGKLDGSVVPQTYRLDLTVDPTKDRFSGHVEIDVDVKKAGRFVWMHGRDLKVGKVTAMVGGQPVAGTFRQVDPTGVALVTFDAPLPAGKTTFAFDYDAPFGEGPAGMFHLKVGDDWYSWTQHESIDARASFPSFDEPGFKVPWNVTLRTPEGLKAVSNAPEVKTETANGMTVHTFGQTLPLPSYLVALMVGPFVTVEGVVPPTPQRSTPLPIRIVSTKTNTGKLDFALEGTKGVVQHLEAYFGQSFPYPKLDQITTPILPGAMENAGADLYADSILVMDDKASTAQKRNFGMIVSHELAHQWFGDLVTPAWWDDIWLNESFANWMGFRIGNEWRPDLNIGAGALAEGFGAMGIDALIAGRPIHQKIEKNAQIDAAFDTITYGKGGHVVAMIAAFMGDTKFRDGVRGYMAAHKYGNATSAEFFKAMAEAAGDPRILPAMQSFTDQQGVPLVTLERAGPQSWKVTQSRFVRYGMKGPDTTWGIPLCMRQSDVRQCTLMTDKTTTVTLKSMGPIMPNAGGTGYYRFELPAKEWDALIAAVPSMSGSEALAVMDSMNASFYAGRLTSDQLIAGSRALAANPDSYASGGATGLLQAMADRGVIAESAKPKFRAFVDGLYAPQLKSLGLDLKAGAHAGDDPEKQQRRVQLVELLAGTARDEALGAKLSTAVDAYLGGDAGALDPALFGAAFDAWLGTHKLDGAKALMDKALASEDPLFRPAALGAIGTTGDAATAKWLLDEFQDKRLRQSEKLNFVRYVVTTPETRDWGYSWMKAHLDELLNGGAGIFFGARLPQILSNFCSVAAADEFDGLRAKFAGKSGALELERTIERVRACGKIKDARGADLTAAIAKLK